MLQRTCVHYELRHETTFMFADTRCGADVRPPALAGAAGDV